MGRLGCVSTYVQVPSKSVLTVSYKSKWANYGSWEDERKVYVWEPVKQ